jgi:hypothetical protein
MDVLERIHAWQKAQSGGRDPSLGVRIETLKDVAGWSVQVDLKGTPLSGLTLAPYKEGATDRDWLAYRIKDDRFEGIGDLTKLRALLFAFLDLADRTLHERARAGRTREAKRHAG